MSRSRVFIGSSTEHLRVAHHLQAELQRYADTDIWDRGVFDAGTSTIERLTEVAPGYDFAVILLLQDDMLVKRGARGFAPRDNLLFEFGLFVGVLGRRRAFFLCDKAKPVALPSDLTGVTFLEMVGDQLPASLGPAILELKNQIGRQGSRPVRDPTHLTWNAYMQGVDKLRHALFEPDPQAGGFHPQLIVSISRGGIIVADLLARELRGLPVVMLWADRTYSDTPRSLSYPKLFNQHDLAAVAVEGNVRRILLVDDCCKSGRSLEAALKFIHNNLRSLPDTLRNDIQIKTAVLAKDAAFDGKRTVRLDYCVFPDTAYLPYGRG